MTSAAVMLAFSLATAQAESQETRRVPKDSVEVTVTGCLKGRVLTTLAEREADVVRGPYVGERVFRLAGKREVMDEIKRRNRQLVEVVGLVKRSALDDKGVKSGQVSITGGSPVAGSSAIPSVVEHVPVMDVASVQVRATSCRAD